MDVFFAIVIILNQIYQLLVYTQNLFNEDIIQLIKFENT